MRATDRDRDCLTDNVIAAVTRLQLIQYRRTTTTCMTSLAEQCQRNTDIAMEEKIQNDQSK